MAAITVAAGVALAGSGAARAQVNAEGMNANVLKPGFGVNLDTTIAVARGNVELLDVSAGGRIQYQTLYPAAPVAEGEEAPPPFLRQRVFIAGNGHYAEAKGAPVVSQTYLHMRWTGMWHPRVGSDLFVQHQNDRFFRLQRRSLIGAGARVEMVHDRRFLLWGGSAYMLELEHIDVQPGAPDAAETVSHRWTNYLTARLAWNDQWLLQSTTYVQPRFDDFNDYRVLEVVEGQGRLTDQLRIGLSLTVLHDSAPPTGVKDTDLRLATGIHLSL